MIPQHSSSRHLLCFMFHSLGAETVKQAPGLHFGRVRSFYGSEPMHPSQCLLASPIKVAAWRPRRLGDVVDGRQEAVEFRLAVIHFFVTGDATNFGLCDLRHYRVLKP
jgi:hypothetical protein